MHSKANFFSRKKSLAMVSQTSSRSILLSSKYRHQQKQHSSHSQKQKKSQQNQKKCEKEEHNLLITLVPSTYKDLLKLLNTEENDSLSATKINKPPTKSVAFSAELEGIEEHEVSNYVTYLTILKFNVKKLKNYIDFSKMSLSNGNIISTAHHSSIDCTGRLAAFEKVPITFQKFI